MSTKQQNQLDKLNKMKKGLMIIELTAEAVGLSFAEITSKSREKYIAVPRHIAIYIIRRETLLNWKAIGELFWPDYDHSTAINSFQVAKDFCDVYPYIREYINEITEKYHYKTSNKYESRKLHAVPANTTLRKIS